MDSNLLTMLLRRSNPKKHANTRLIFLKSGVFVFILALFGLFGSVFPTSVHAQTQANINSSALSFAQTTGLATQDIRTYIVTVIRGFFLLLGLLTVLLIMYAGFQIFTARGDATKVQNGTTTLRNAIAGLIIILLSYGIAEFVIRAIMGGPQGGSNGSSNPVVFSIAPNGSDALGNGIIASHYPNRDQSNVPRNTMISITFKQPIGLGTIFLNYNDNNTYTTSDDAICSPDCDSPSKTESAVTATTQLLLNTDNIKIIPQSIMPGNVSGTNDQQFSALYTAALTNGTGQENVFARVTPTAATFDVSEYQTVTIVPVQPLGSPTNNVNYRVALRGGTTGIKVWNTKRGGTQELIDAFKNTYPNGGYFWSFATSTVIDLTPPKLVSVVPNTASDPVNQSLFRNQLLQMYFDEPIDPTTASGTIGVGGGFSNILVKAKCAIGSTCTGVSATNFDTVPGRLIVGSNYQVVEYTPSAGCDAVSENTCGDPVYCLPANVDLAITTNAASLGTNPPQADATSGGIFDGVTDMAGNSLNGNRNNTADGPNSTERPNEFSLNNPQPASNLASVSDSVEWLYRVGGNIDLTPPKVTAIDPTSFGPPPTLQTAYPAGPSSVPPTTPISLTWDKTLSIASLRTGAFGNNTVAISLGANECVKRGTAACVAGTTCACDPAPPPAFSVVLNQPTSSTQIMQIQHRQFFDSSDLGYSAADVAAVPSVVPTFVPKVGSSLRDTLQNCFYPSAGFSCPVGSSSCCNRTGQTTFNCPL